MALKISEVVGKLTITKEGIRCELPSSGYETLHLTWIRGSQRNKSESQKLKLLYSFKSSRQQDKYNFHSFWLIGGKLYLSNDQELSLDDAVALVNLEKNKRRLQIEKAHALQAMVENLDGKNKRGHISQEVRLEVWQRDGGRCVDCSSQLKLEFDHIIPVAMGGSDTARNLQLLCETCNRRKGASLG